MEEQKTNIPVVPIAIGGVAFLLGCVLIGAAVVITVSSGALGGVAAIDATSTPAQSAETSATPTELVIQPTATPEPTDEPTATPEPSATPTITPTFTSPPPTAVPVTNTPVPPTDTPAPTSPPGPVVGPDDRVSNVSFSLEKTTVSPGEEVWFNFSFDSNVGDDLLLGFIGATTFDNNGTQVNFQPSWTNNVYGDVALPWRDNIKPGTLNQPGTYWVYFTICFGNCSGGGGDWRYPVAPVQLTVQ
jgi:hypothetical protein